MGRKKWFHMSLGATGGHRSTVFGPPGPPQPRKGATGGETVSSIACRGRKRPTGDSISTAGGVLGRRQACGAWWWAWRYWSLPPPGGFFLFFFLRMGIGWILGSRPPEIERRTEAHSPSSVNCNECIPKKNRHSESVPRIHSLVKKGLPRRQDIWGRGN